MVTPIPKLNVRGQALHAQRTKPSSAYLEFWQLALSSRVPCADTIERL
jgi:hypothetical protein